MKSAALPISDDLDRRIVKASDPKFPIFVAPFVCIGGEPVTHVLVLVHSCPVHVLAWHANAMPCHVTCMSCHGMPNANAMPFTFTTPAIRMA